MKPTRMCISYRQSNGFVEDTIWIFAVASYLRKSLDRYIEHFSNRQGRTRHPKCIYSWSYQLTPR